MHCKRRLNYHGNHFLVMLCLKGTAQSKNEYHVIIYSLSVSQPVCCVILMKINLDT